MPSFLEIMKQDSYGIKLDQRQNSRCLSLSPRVVVVREGKNEASAHTLKTVSKMPASSVCHTWEGKEQTPVCQDQAPAVPW